MAELDEIWLPLVDEPIGGIVRQLEEDDRELAALVDSPRRLLAFRTFAYIRVGLLLGQLLVEHDVEPYDGTDTWVEQLLREPRYHDAVKREVRAVAEDVANDPRYADEEPLGPDEDARARFREFARKQLGG